MTAQERQALISSLSFEGEIEDCEGVFMFTVKKDFDLAAAFEGIYNPEQDPPIHWSLNVRMACGIICGGYSRSVMENGIS